MTREITLVSNTPAIKYHLNHSASTKKCANVSAKYRPENDSAAGRNKPVASEDEEFLGVNFFNRCVPIGLNKDVPS